MKREICYCAFCKNEKRIYTSKSLGWSKLILLMVLASITSSLVTNTLEQIEWIHAGKVGWGLLVILLLSILCVEIAAHLRWRMSLKCVLCGFDPVLYKQSPTLAAEIVKSHLERRKEDPTSVLSRPLLLPRILKKKGEKATRLDLEI